MTPARACSRPTRGHGRKRDPRYAIRRLLLAACDDLDARGARLADGLRRGDTARSVPPDSWKEITRDLSRSHDRHAAREALALLYAWAHSGDLPEMRRFARTVARWQTEIFAWHTTGGPRNGPTEAVNLAIKNIKRVGRGFRNLSNYRLRLLLHCGGVNWQDQPAARLRGRPPRLVA